MKIKKMLLALLLVFFVAGCSINIGTTDEPSNETTTEQKEVSDDNQAVSDDQAISEDDVKVSLAKAKKIALDHVNLNKKDVQFVESSLEMDDGIAQYEIEFRHGNVGHEFEINANTGKIISYDMDND